MEHTVCFIGHRKIENTPALRERLQKILSELIETGTVTFIFGDHSEFNDLCYEMVTALKEKHPEIMRKKFRKDYEDADEYTMQFLKTGLEENVCPKGIGNAGRAGYIKRNQAMISESDICVFYYDENYRPASRRNDHNLIKQPKSGTALAFRYAQTKKKRIINCF